MTIKNTLHQMTHASRICLMFLFSSFASPNSIADENVAQPKDSQSSVWSLSKKKDGVQIAQRTIENSPFLETRGQLSAPIKLLDALAVLGDVEACSQWLFDCKQGEVLSSQGLGKRTYYTVIDAPFTFQDRDSVVQSSLCYRPDEQVLNIKMHGVENGLPLHEKRVRVLQFVGSWTLQQRENGQLDMTYQIHSNPQIGATGAVNRTMRKSVRVTLLNVARLASRAPYVNSLPTDSELAEITACEDHKATSHTW